MCGKSTTNRLPALAGLSARACPPAVLFSPEARPREEVSSRFARQKLCLSKAAFAAAILMQRNGYHQIGLEFGRLVEHDFCQEFYKPVRKRAHLLKFQRHRANQRIHVASEAARAVDVEWFCAARQAKALAYLVALNNQQLSLH